MTDAIFEQLDFEVEEAEEDPTVLRLSLDAKAVVKIGPFSRRGKSRTDTQGCDHDFHPKATVTPYGIFLPELDEVFLYLATSKVTSDFMADTLDAWWESNRERFGHVKTLLINQDNGPENHSRRTQFMKRMVEFSMTHKLNLRLAYYPPYHSKYNPIERVWGVLENHWNGDILDEIETVVNFAQTMTWMGKHPVVTLVTKTYQTGVKLTQKAMAQVETQIQRLTHSKLEGLPDLGKWFVDISYRPSGSNGPGNNAKAESLIQYALWATLLHVSCVSESLKSPRGKGFITINTRFDISQISSILYG